MIVQHIGTTRDGLNDRNIVLLGKGREFSHRIRILHAATSNDHRTLRRFNGYDSIFDFMRIWCLTPDAMDFAFEHFDRVVESPALNILR